MAFCDFCVMHFPMGILDPRAYELEYGGKL